MTNWYTIGFTLSLMALSLYDICDKNKGDGLMNILLSLAWPAVLVIGFLYGLVKAYDRMLGWMIGDIK